MVLWREQCPECEGTGTVPVTYCDHGCEWLGDAESDEWGVLPECGHRRARMEYVTCPHCCGRGEVGVEPGLTALGLPVPETLPQALEVIERLLRVVNSEVELRESMVRRLSRQLERERERALLGEER